MRSAPARRVDAVWGVLCVVTVISALLASVRGRSDLAASRAVTVAVVLIAGIKVRLVIREFMYVRTAPIWLRRLTDLWLVTLLSSVLGLYLW